MLNEFENNNILKMAQTLLLGESSSCLTPTIILQKLRLVISLKAEWKLANEDLLLDELIRRNSVTSGDYKRLGNEADHIKWYSQERKSNRPYWQRYREYIEASLPWSAVERLDDITDDILSDLEDPLRCGEWDRRGLVVGHVQSGKTSNYTGLICKAADSGYKIIIVLAGLHNNLRAQTQARLDEGFLGYETNPTVSGMEPWAMRSIGVGQLNSDPALRPQWVTTRLESGDFKAKVAQNLGVTPEKRPWLFVVKKQKSVLAGLIKWLSEHVADTLDRQTGKPIISELPLLMIDDEADNASVDTGEQAFDSTGSPDLEHQPKTINSSIRKILHLFNKKAYVGYTATPFANIFIHEKAKTKNEGVDLFPSSFIYNLEAPSNYIGPSKVFGINLEKGRAEGLPLVRVVDDHCGDHPKTGWMPNKHSKNHIPTFDNLENLPPSLLEAIDSFLLGCAVKNLRGMEKKHSSMLIHVTRFQDVQAQLKNAVEHYISLLDKNIKRNIGAEQIFERLQKFYDSDFQNCTNKVNQLGIFEKLILPDWQEVKTEVSKLISEVKIKAVNGSVKDALDYADSVDPQRVIAIGGDKLARGLTLEGLVTSYFLRASNMYDTLMQMGRWFGYRDGYIDLCRLYTTEDLVEWFEHISDASEELRAEFNYMVQTGQTPLQYGLKVRSHPTLLVTSRIKMRSAKEMQLSFSGEISETVAFDIDKSIIKSNLTAFRRLFSIRENIELHPSLDVGDKKVRWNGVLIKGIKSSEVIDFLSAYKTHAQSYKADSSLLASFIQNMNNSGELDEWNLAVINGSSECVLSLDGYEFKLTVRKERKPTLNRYSIGRLISPKDELIDLSKEEWEHALMLTRRDRDDAEMPSGKNARVAKHEISGDKAKGLLIIYLLDPAQYTPFELGPDPVVGFGLSFPSSTSGTKVKYVVNVIGQDDYA